MATDPKPKREAVLRLASELELAGRRLRQLRKATASKAHPDIEGAQLVLLARIVTLGPVRMSELAEDLGIDKGPISRGCARLAELGMVKRVADRQDARASLLTATAAGKRVAARSEKALAAAVPELSGSQLQSIGNQLARFNKTLADG